MRSQRLLSQSSRQTLCVFCATRLGIEAGAPLPAQRRHLQSSRVSGKPPAAAEATQEDDEPSTYQPRPREPPRFGGGWAQSSFSSELTPEEEKQRQLLRKKTQKERGAIEQAARPRDVRTVDDGRSWGYNFSDRREDTAYDNRALRNTSTDYRADPRPINPLVRKFVAKREGLRNCPSCGVPNPDDRSSCIKCSLLFSTFRRQGPYKTAVDQVNYEPLVQPSNWTTARVDDSPYNSEIASTWQHVRRRGDRSSQTRDVQEETPAVSSKIETEPDPALVEARLEREKLSRNGAFVGFGGAGTWSDSNHRFSRVESPPLEPGIPMEPADKRPVVPGVTGTSEESTFRVRHIDYKPTDTPVPEVQGAKPTGVFRPAIDKSWMDQSDESDSEARDTTATRWKRWKPSQTEPVTEDHNLSGNKGVVQKTAYAEQSFDLEERQERRERRAKRQFLDAAPPADVHESYERRRQPRRHRRADYDEEAEEEDVKIERRRQRKQEKISQRAVAPATPIYLPEFISVSNLATALKVKLEDFIYTMQTMGFEGLSNDHVFDGETAGLIAVEYNFDPVIDQSESQDLQARALPEDKSLLPPRPPVVTIMGHVDHGKTTLLDWLRKSSVAASEHGGITQHIGAFSVPMPSGKIITFLDTPGHAAFLSMRQRGANVTDIVILVVAADDSVKPQTIEAIKHAKAANVPIIVAANKIDKEGASVEKVKQDLARHGVELEDYGGDTQVVCVSGKTGQGMEELEEAVIALADILDIRAETDGPAEGWVLEATTNKAGRVATVLVRRGTMRPGDVIVAGSTWARIRSLRNEAGVQIEAAGPGTPVQIDGWREQPVAGDEILEATDEQKAKSVVDLRRERDERLKMAADMEAVNESRRIEHDEREREKQLADGETAEPEEQQHSGIKEVFFIVKGDVSGSVEAVLNSVSALGNEEVRPHILRSGVGPVTEFDVEHAAVAKGHVINFNTQVEPNISRAAEAAGVLILNENIIYRLVDDVKARLSEHLTPLKTHRVVGEAEIAQVFEIKVKGKATIPVAGCRIRNGVVQRNAKVKVLREKEVMYQGTLSTLKSVKKDVTEMRKGNECGLSFDGWGAFQVGDQVQCYEEKVEKRYL